MPVLREFERVVRALLVAIPSDDAQELGANALSFPSGYRLSQSGLELLLRQLPSGGDKKTWQKFLLQH